jgi:hypothetical protein
MSVRNKVIAGTVVILALAIGLAVFVDVGGLRRACMSVPDRDRNNYDTSMALSGRANEAFASRHYSVANDLLDLALLSLGDSYAAGSAVDDTGTMLVAAKTEVAKSNFQLAARMKQDVLNTRLSVYRKKTDIARRCQSVVKRVIQ